MVVWMVGKGIQILVLRWVALGVGLFHRPGWLVVDLWSQLGGLSSTVEFSSNGDFFKVDVQDIFRGRGRLAPVLWFVWEDDVE